MYSAVSFVETERTVLLGAPITSVKGFANSFSSTPFLCHPLELS